MKLVSRCTFALAALSLCSIAHAQGGCVNSPENPTAVLGLVGLAATSFATWRARRR